MWDERYGSPGRTWSGEPNPVLVEVAAQLSLGTALDVGCGEGADAVWLARRGWQVTALDFSAEGLRVAAAAAQDAGVQVDWIRADAAQWHPPKTFDLVNVQYFHGPPDARRAVHRLAWQATEGTLLVVGHHPTHPGGPPDASKYGTTAILTALGVPPDAPGIATATRSRGDAVDAVVAVSRSGEQIHL